MKKLSKFVFGTISVASLAAGAYYLYKNVINKDSSDDFDDFDEFDDEFDEFDIDDEQPEKDMREYVSINITTKENDSKIEVSETLPEDLFEEEATEQAADAEDNE